VSIIGSWFSSKNRGFFGGLYGTGSNIGNILGISVAGVLLNQNEDDWKMLFFILGAIFVVNIGLVIATLKATPESVGIVVNLESLPPG